MNFDPERVLALSKVFDFPRAVNTEGERRAADLIAEEFQRAGLHVERRPVRGEPFQYAPWPILAVMLGWGILAAFPDASPVVLLTLMATGMTGLVAAFRVQLLLDRASPSIPTEQVIGGWPRDSPPPTRVVVFTRHATPPSRGVLIEKALYSMFGNGFWLPLVVPTVFVETVRWPQNVRISLLVGWWISTLLMLGLPVNRGAEERSRRYRTGLAVLAELARSWPKGHGDRIEVLFVATGGIWNGPRELSKFVRHDAARRPTLVINLDAPGLGSRLVFIGSKPGLALANEAAKGLWLPHRVSRHRWESPLIGGFTGPGLAYVSLRGDRRSAPIDPATLSATGQLVIEMALRWAKQARGTCETRQSS